MSEFSHILQKEIEAARKEAVKSVPSHTHQDLVAKNLGSGPQGPKESRHVKRLRERQINRLDNLINMYFQFRMFQENPDGPEVHKKFVELDNAWRRRVTNFNSKGRKGYPEPKGVLRKDHVNGQHTHPIELLPDAFAEKVKYFIEMEHKQVAAAKRKAEEKISEHWLKTNRHRLYKMYPVRWALYWLFSAFIPKYYNAKWARYYRKNIYQE